MWNYNEYGHGHNCGCGCRTVPNAYRHPLPKEKECRFLDAVLIEKFELVGEKCSEVDVCCGDIPAKVEFKNTAIVLSAKTNCLEGDVCYTFDIPSAAPICFSGYDVFIRTEPCGFLDNGVNITETKVEVPFTDDMLNFYWTPEKLQRYYSAKYKDCECEHEPKKVEDFAKVVLDLRANKASSNDFFRGKDGWCTRPTHKYMLYRNNNKEWVLERDLRTTYKYGDFR